MTKNGMPLKMEFYRGVKAIAAFLGVHPSTVERYLQEGKIPAKQDDMGVWVLCNVDYYLSLEKKHGAAQG
jgi:predicted site-specific integrase-resolvase